MNNILERIHAKYYGVSTTIKKEPTMLYIGRSQVKDLAADLVRLKSSDLSCSIKAGGDTRPEIMGLTLYLVNSDDHLEVL